MIKIKLVYLIIILIPLLLTSCFAGKYHPQRNPELSSIALVSIIGYEASSPVDEIVVLERDEYGRYLYFGTNEDFNFVMVCQKYDSEYAYYYPDFCFMATDAKYAKHVNLDEFDELKVINDWNLPLDDSKMKKVDFNEDTRGRKRYNVVGKFTSHFSNPQQEYQTIWDDYGRSLYYVKDSYDEKTHTWSARYFIIIQADGSYYKDVGIVKQESIDSYQNQLREFKAANHWDVDPALVADKN